METLTASIDSNDPRLLAEAEVDLTFRLGRNPLSYYSDTFERCTRWTFEFKSSGLPFKPCLIGIISKFMCKEFDLGNVSMVANNTLNSHDMFTLSAGSKSISCVATCLPQ